MTNRFLNDQFNDEVIWADFYASWPDYIQPLQVIPPRGELKRKALSCLDEHEYQNGWNKHAHRKYVVKRHKIRNSNKKSSRNSDNQLTDRVNWYLQFSH